MRRNRAHRDVYLYEWGGASPSPDRQPGGLGLRLGRAAAADGNSTTCQARKRHEGERARFRNIAGLVTTAAVAMATFVVVLVTVIACHGGSGHGQGQCRECSEEMSLQNDLLDQVAEIQYLVVEDHPVVNTPDEGNILTSDYLSNINFNL
jgi:hypothetical protein